MISFHYGLWGGGFIHFVCLQYPLLVAHGKIVLISTSVYFSINLFNSNCIITPNLLFLTFQSVAEVAEDIWDHYGFDFGTDFSGIFKALSHVNYNVRLAAAEALAAALDEYPDSIQVCLLYNFDSVVGRFIS